MIHVTALESMAAELNDLGVNVTAHDLMTKIICSLPPMFDFLSTSWDNIPDEEKTMDGLRARLVSEQRRINARRNEDLTGGANGTSPGMTNNSHKTHAGVEGDGAALYGSSNRGQASTRNNYRGSGNRGNRGKQLKNKGQRDTIDRDSAKCTYCGKHRHYEFERRLRIANEGDKQQNAGKRQKIVNREDRKIKASSLLYPYAASTLHIPVGCTWIREHLAT